MANMRPGDWMCPGCGEHKYARKTECICGAKRPVAVQPVTPVRLAGAPATTQPVTASRQQGALKPGDWNCPACGDHQFARNAKCRQCGAAKPAAVADATVIDPPPKGAGAWYLALDIETRGSWYTNPVVAIGVFLAPQVPQPGQTMIKKRWALKALPGQVDETRCMEEFWSQFKEVDQWIRANEKDARDVMLELRAFCREHATAKDIVLLTDCPDFDLGRLDQLGHATGTWDMPVRYLDVNKRHNQRDPGERLSQAGSVAKAGFAAWLQQRAPHAKHTHFPDDDAEQLYWQMVYCDTLRGK